MSGAAFDSAIALQPQPDGSFLGHTSPAYANMVGPYGGITAAT
ncbi:MAG TPA: thioesterase family protein, partial [Hydrogenophaga sp.]